MEDTEFGEQAASIADRIRELGPDDRIAAACRGSANPSALAWLAEALRLGHTATVVDLGAGLGGPAAWMSSRYGCTVVAVEPEMLAAQAAASIFDVPAVVAVAGEAPFAGDLFDASLLFGVVSVATDPLRVLAEAARISRALGLLDYCSTGTETVSAGGSQFRTEQRLRDMVESAWRIDEFSAVGIGSPQRWTEAADDSHEEANASEAEVVGAIEDGRIAPVMMVATR